MTRAFGLEDGVVSPVCDVHIGAVVCARIERRCRTRNERQIHHRRHQRNASKGGYEAVRLKVLFAVVMGLLAVVLTPLPSRTGGMFTTTLPVAQVASGARMQQPQASAPAAAGQAPAVQRIAKRWHHRPPGHPGPSPSPSPSPAVQEVNCALVVPEHPLSARGLATPWQLTRDGAGPCNEANPDDSAFVEAAILDPATGQVSAYDPLVVDRGSSPAVAPVQPSLPDGAVVGIWVGYNGNNLTLRGPGSDSCVNGVDGSIFGQNAFCNASAFFEAANRATRAGKLAAPALGTAKDGRPCPTVRDFSVVDQDQSDNTTTTYLATADGRMAQDTPANVTRLTGAQVAKNGSDEGLLDRAIDKALGCTPWTVPDLADTGHQQRITSWPLNELMAAARQAAPVALVPAGDPFVAIGNDPSLRKLDAYRAGVDMPMVTSLSQADTKTYCRNMLRTGLPRVAADRQFTQALPSPSPANASNLFTFLAFRFNQAFSNNDGFLHCEQLLGVQNPVQLRLTDGVVTGAVIDLDPGPPAPTPKPLDQRNR